MPTHADLELIDDLVLEWDATEASKQAARYTFAAFAAFMAARDGDLTTATPADCKAFLDGRAGEVAPATVVKNWTQLKAFYRLAEADTADCLGGRRSPMARLPRPRAPKYVRTKAARVEEFDALMATFDRRTTRGLRDATICSLMFRSGLRVGELGQLDLSDVDLDQRRVLIEQTKNDEPRRPPIHPETMTLLRRYLRRRGERPGPLFENVGPRAHTARMRTASIQTMFKRAAHRAGVELTPHTLRRGWWAEYVEHGGDVVTGMHIAGWAREVMPHRYLADRRDDASQVVFDDVAARQVAARRRRTLRAVN